MKKNNLEPYLYSLAGVAIMVVVLLAFYVVAGAFKQRLDFTAEKAFTLSQGTKNILGKLDTRVTVRFYCTRDNNLMPVQLRNYAQQVEDLLNEYKQAAHGKIVLEKYDPEPDTDAEDSAHMDGVQGQAVSIMGGDRIYLGLVMSQLDKKEVIPMLNPAQERLLEYDVSSAISRVVHAEKPVIGLMSALPVFGNDSPMMRAMGQQSQPAAVFVGELKKDFDVRDVPMTSSNIDPDIKVLIVYHPRDITEEAQFAIDQFVLRGGRLMAFLDPHAYFDQKHDQMAQVLGESSGQSTLSRLITAWGLDFDMNKVVADMTFANHNQRGLMPTVLMLNESGVNKNDILTSDIDNIVLAFAGTFTGKVADGLKETILLKSSLNSELVEGMTAGIGGEQIVKEFKPSNVSYALAVRLTGKFKTAFPEGRPKGKEAAGTNAPAATETVLKESTGEPAVVLVGDSDMLNDQVCVQVQDLMGYRMVQRVNGNLSFFQNAVEQLAGDSNLIEVRSRASLSRPFTRLENMRAAAQMKYESQVKELQDKLEATQNKLNQLQQQKQDANQKLILSPEQQQAIANFRAQEAEAKKNLRTMEKQLRKDTDSLEFWTKMVNIAAMPILVAFTGVVLAFVKRKKIAAK